MKFNPLYAMSIYMYDVHVHLVATLCLNCSAVPKDTSQIQLLSQATHTGITIYIHVVCDTRAAKEEQNDTIKHEFTYTLGNLIVAI